VLCGTTLQNVSDRKDQCTAHITSRELICVLDWLDFL
jgi:hypothetical protein